MDFKERLNNLSRHLMTGVSYMIPVVVAGGLLLSISVLIGGPGVWDAKGGFAANLRDIGLTGLQLIVPVIAAYVAYSIADKPGIGPGLICGMIAFKIGTGFLGGLIVGLIVGYLVELIKKIPVGPSLIPLISIMLIPIGTTFIVGMLLIYVIGAPITAMTNGITAWLGNMQGGNQVILAVILGGMMAFDMGGPINKIAYTFGMASYTQQVYGPSSAMLIAIAIPPLGLALATILAPKKYSEEEREAGKSAILMGCIGITEGAIPFAVGDPLRVIPSIMVGCAITSGLSMALGVVNPTAMATVMAIPFVNKPLLQIVSILAGVVVTALLINLLKSIGKSNKLSEDQELAS